MGETRNSYKIFVGKYEGRRPVWKPGRKYEDVFKEIRFVDDLIRLVQDRFQRRIIINTVIRFRVP
jgi:hypothetical protein